jgi:hypothetical protein
MNEIFVGADDRSVERLIQGGDGVTGPLISGIGPHQDAVRLHEVLDRRPLPKELGAGDIGEVRLVAANGPAGPHRDRALHHQRLALGFPDLLDGALHRREIGVSRHGGRRLHADEDQASILKQLPHVLGEGEALGVLGDQLGQPRFVDRHLAAPERLNLLRHDLPDHDAVAELGEAGSGDEPDPAGSDHSDRLPLAHGHLARLRSPGAGGSPRRS